MGFTASTVKRYYLAGGGSEAEFDVRWQRRMAESRDAGRRIAAGELHTAGGGIQYVIGGRRPATGLARESH
jgi:hypothetical protein